MITKYSRLSILVADHLCYLRDMATKSWKSNIIEEHIRQNYDGEEYSIDVESIRNRYHHFPNEALYIIDCRNALLEPITDNFFDIVGIERSNKNDLLVLYDHIHQNNQQALHLWVINNLQNAFDQKEGFVPEKDIWKCLYQTHDGRVLLKAATALAYDSKGTMRYTLGKLTDLSGLVNFSSFGYQYEGPNRDRILNSYQARAQEMSELTKREREILLLLGEGYTSQVIAAKLFISVHTVDTHRRNIIEKLETKTAFEAYQKSKNLGWL